MGGLIIGAEQKRKGQSVAENMLTQRLMARTKMSADTRLDLQWVPQKWDK